MDTERYQALMDAAKAVKFPATIRFEDDKSRFMGHFHNVTCIDVQDLCTFFYYRDVMIGGVPNEVKWREDYRTPDEPKVRAEEVEA